VLLYRHAMNGISGNLGNLCAAYRHETRTAVVDLVDAAQPREVDYATFDAACDAVARALTKAGLGVGDRFGLLSYNRLEFLEIFYGAMRAGIVPVPINIQLPKATVEWIAGDSAVRLMFSDDAHRALCPQGVRVIGIEDGGPQGYQRFKDPGRFDLFVPPDDAVAFQPYTSGSTGRPKGVLLSHKAHVWVSKTIARDRRIAPRDRMMVASPLYHKNAMNAVKSVLVSGASMVLMPRFDARAYLAAIGRYGATTLSGVPTMYAMLLRERDLIAGGDYSQVRLLTLGGAPASDPLIDALAAAFPKAEIVQILGITETSAAIFGAHPEGRQRPPHSVGWPLPGNEIRLVGGGMPDIGVLHVKSPGMMLGYHNNPQETAQRLKDGWFDTGDIVRRDAQGWYFFVDRADDMFVSGGHNIFPGEVEDLLERHPGIHQAAVVAVPDELKHRLPCAFVTRHMGATLSEDEVKRYVLDNAPPYMHPRRVFFVAELPLTGAGKIDRKALEAKARELSAASPRT
jgi:acyl-CoA synthetase (AMP-forming)/AMP-acid ligase II